MSSKKRQLVQAVTLRGEGVHIATKHESVLRAGQVGRAVSLDFTSAQVPQKRFSADAATVELGSDVVRILFAQKSALGDRYEHMIVVKMPFVAVRQFLLSMVSVADLARGFLSKFSVPAAPAWDKGAMTGQTFSLDANVVVAGFTGREGCIDFYHASPHVIRALKEGGDFYAEPIVRVVLTARVLIHIHDLLQELQPSMPFDEMEVQP